MSSWTSRAVCGELGISYRQLDYWLRTGLLNSLPAKSRSKPTPGTGFRRELTEEEVVLLEEIVGLYRLGLSLPAIRRRLHKDRSLERLWGDLRKAGVK